MSLQPGAAAADRTAEAALLEQALFEVKKVIVGQDRAIERLLRLPARPGPRAPRGRARPGQDARRRDPRHGRRRHASPASSSPPTCSPPTSSAPASTAARTETFDVELGPVFANFVLADEINRAPAKVQSALLEVMAEHQVSIGGTTRPVPEPVPRARHPEPDRERGRLPAARGPARPLPHEGRRRLPDRRRGGRDRPPHGRAAPRCRRRCSSLDDLVRAPGGRRRGATSTTPSSTTPSASCSPPASRPRHGLPELAELRHATAPAPVPASAWSPAAGPSPCCGAAPTSSPRTSSTSPPTCCATASCSSYEALAQGLVGRAAARPPPLHRPRPASSPRSQDPTAAAGW